MPPCGRCSVIWAPLVLLAGCPARSTVSPPPAAVTFLFPHGGDEVLSDRALNFEAVARSRPPAHVLQAEWRADQNYLGGCRYPEGIAAWGLHCTIQGSLARGPHTIEVSVLDDRGTTTRASIRVTALPAAVAFASPDPNFPVEASSAVPVTVRADSELGGVERLELSVDGEAPVTSVNPTPCPGTAAVCSSSMSLLIPLGVGRHTLSAAARLAGGRSAETTVSIQAAAPPSASIQFPTEGLLVAPGRPLNLKGSAFDPDGKGLIVEWTSSVEGPLASTLQGEGVLNTPGKHRLTLEVTDASGLSAVTSVSVYARAGGDELFSPTVAPPPAGPGFPYIRSLFVEPDGAVWAGSGNGAARRDPVTLRWTSFGPPLPAVDCFSLDGLGGSWDLAGTVWAGTFDGAWRYDGRAWTQFPLAGVGFEVRAMAWDAGTLWFGLREGQVLRYDGSTVATFTDPPLSSGVRTLVLDPVGAPWVGTDAGIARYVGNDHWMPVPSPLDGTGVSALVWDDQGNLWAAGDQGIWVDYPSTSLWTPYGAIEGAPPPPFSALLPVAPGVVFLGGPSGLFRLAVAFLGWTPFDLPSDVPAFPITALALDPAGAVWIGTAGGGLTRYHAL